MSLAGAKQKVMRIAEKFPKMFRGQNLESPTAPLIPEETHETYKVPKAVFLVLSKYVSSRWSIGELSQVFNLRKSGYDYGNIAVEMGRTESACLSKWRRVVKEEPYLMDEISQALGEEGSFPPEVLPESSISMTNVIVGKKRNRKPKWGRRGW